MFADPNKKYSRWREAPLFTLAWLFVAGMISAWWLNAPCLAWLTSLGFIFILTAYRVSRRLHNMRIANELIIAFLTGASIMSTYKSKITTGPVSCKQVVCIISTVDLYSKGLRLKVKIPTPLNTYTTKAIIYIRSPVQEFRPGDRIQFSGILKPIHRPRYDFQFNFRKYWLSKGITLQGFFEGGEVTRIPHNLPFHVGRLTDSVNARWTNLITTNIPSSNARAIILAMLLGDRSMIDVELSGGYKRAGAMHILAISGLHIGIITAILASIAGWPRPDQPKLVIMMRVASICIPLWTYVSICGLPPSATRAAFMFTIYVVGKTVARQPSTLNILGLTAIVLLIREPYMLFNLSFQFSYLALIGILTWGKVISRLIQIKQRLLRFTWQTIAISSGAQLLLLPMMIYYFGMVSIVSPITSILAIPAASLIMVGSIITSVLLALNAPLGRLSAEILASVIDSFNSVISRIGQLPFAAIDAHATDNRTLIALILALILFTIRLYSDSLIIILTCIPASAYLICCLLTNTFSGQRNADSITQFRSNIPAISLHLQGKCFSTVNPIDHDRHIVREAENLCRLYRCDTSTSLSPHTKYNLIIQDKSCYRSISIWPSGNLAELPNQILLH